jgi:TfoX/Sxy family transcriptional regulator of competence genes
MMATKAKRAMPKWTKPPEALVALFGKLLDGLPGTELRQMFGCPVAFVSGNMLSGLHQSSMMLRLSDTDRAAFQQRYRARLFEPIPGRAMREYVVLPDSLLEDPRELKRWVARGHAYVASLPPKQRRSRQASARRPTKKG